MNIPGNWSMGHLKGKVSGLLDDPNQLLTSPWARMGLGLLSENAKPFGGNPAQGLLTGLSAAKETKEQQADRERIEELRRQIAAWMQQQQLARMGGVQAPGGGWQSPIAPGSQPPANLMDLYRRPQL